MKPLLLVTCTTGRPKMLEWQLKKLKECKDRNFQHLIIHENASDLPSNVPIETVTVLRDRGPAASEGHSLPHQLAFALPHIRNAMKVFGSTQVAFIEDDDWYNFEHYFPAVRGLESEMLIGFQPVRYHHITSSASATMLDNSTAPLAFTTMHYNMIPALNDAVQGSIRDGDPYVDMRLWATPNVTKTYIKMQSTALCVGLKGYPYGQKSDTGGQSLAGFPYKRDPERKRLKDWMGADYDLFNAFHGGILKIKGDS